MSKLEAAIACHRFGLGARPGELEAVGADARGWLLGQLEGQAPTPRQLRDLPDTADHFTTRGDYFVQRRAFVRSKQAEASRSENPEAVRGEIEEAGRWMQTALGVLFRDALMLEFGRRFNVAVTTDQPFRERLVRFWSNHLVVPNAGGKVVMYTGSYEREAIRPHVAGRFVDMLLASARHPAMLLFLDNDVSVGPQSPYGQETGSSLNENLAREILELHTLGVDGGYSQEDVIELAKGISGWSVVRVPGLSDTYTREPFPDLGKEPGTFHFYADRHQPPPAILLGKRYDQPGIAQGESMLRDLAHHPSTARFLATKLARHFVADEPPEALVERLAKVYLQTGTDLSAMSRALVESPEAWQPELSKLRQPEDYVIAVSRALGRPVAGDRVGSPVAEMDLMNYDWRQRRYALAYDRRQIDPGPERVRQMPESMQRGFEVVRLYNVIADMGQPPMKAPGPQGWYDRWSDWSSADSIMKRIEYGVRMAELASSSFEPRAFLRSTLGELADEHLRQAVSRAATPAQGLALTLTSPHFNRR